MCKKSNPVAEKNVSSLSRLQLFLLVFMVGIRSGKETQSVRKKEVAHCGSNEAEIPQGSAKTFVRDDHGATVAAMVRMCMEERRDRDEQLAEENRAKNEQMALLACLVAMSGMMRKTQELAGLRSGRLVYKRP